MTHDINRPFIAQRKGDLLWHQMPDISYTKASVAATQKSADQTLASNA